MNLFRSEEHIRNWAGFRPGTEQGILPLSDLVRLFSLDFFRRRMEADYVSHAEEYVSGFLSAVAEIGRKLPFWALEPPG